MIRLQSELHASPYRQRGSAPRSGQFTRDALPCRQTRPKKLTWENFYWSSSIRGPFLAMHITIQLFTYQLKPLHKSSRAGPENAPITFRLNACSSHLMAAPFIFTTVLPVHLTVARRPTIPGIEVWLPAPPSGRDMASGACRMGSCFLPPIGLPEGRLECKKKILRRGPTNRLRAAALNGSFVASPRIPDHAGTVPPAVDPSNSPES
jgi:hypothetical protein